MQLVIKAREVTGCAFRRSKDEGMRKEAMKEREGNETGEVKEIRNVSKCDEGRM